MKTFRLAMLVGAVLLSGAVSNAFASVGMPKVIHLMTGINGETIKLRMSEISVAEMKAMTCDPQNTIATMGYLPELKFESGTETYTLVRGEGPGAITVVFNDANPNCELASVSQISEMYFLMKSVRYPRLILSVMISLKDKSVIITGPIGGGGRILEKY